MQIILPTISSLILLILGAIFIISHVKELLIEERKRESKELVQSIYNVIDNVYTRVQIDSITSHEAKNQVKFIVESALYGNDQKDYYFLLNTNANIIAHPYFSDKASLNKTNKQFRTTLKNIGQYAKQNGKGYYEYRWQWKNEATIIEDKISYVKYFEPWGWTLGTGFYFKEVDDEIAPLIKYVSILILIISSIISIFYTVIIYRASRNIKVLVTHERELSKSEKRFRNMSENFDNGLIILENHKIVYTNNKLREILDIEESDSFSLRAVDYLVPEEQKRYESVKVDLFDPDKPENEFGFWIFTKKRERKYLLLHSTGERIGNNLYNYLLLHDHTYKKLKDSELKSLNEIIKQIPNSLVITDLGGNIVYANSVFERVTGYKLDEVIGKKNNILKSDKMLPAVYNDLWKTISSGEVWENDLLNKKKNGDLYWERTIIFPVRNESNEIINYCAIKTDLTRQHKLEEELIRSKEEAVVGQKIKTAFLKNVSHEVNTPLNAILGFTQLLHSELPESDTDFKYLSIIMNNTKTLIKLFRDIMDYTKLESGNIEIFKTEIKLDEFINKIVSRYNVKLLTEFEKDIEISIDIPEQYKNAVIVSDHDRLLQIIEELLINAIKFTNQGQINIGYRIDYEKVEFFVKDTGVGIPKSERENIFNAFTHGEKLYVSLHKGTGLGLAIIKQLANYIGGKLDFSSIEDEGSTFYLSLPSIDAKNYVLDERSIDEFPFKDLLKGKRAIVAEDNDESFIYIKSILEQDLNEIARVMDGDELMKLTDDRKFNYDFILISSAPQFDSANNARIIKNFDKDINVIAMDRNPKEIFDLGKNVFDDRISKPFSKNDLFKILNRIYF